MAETEQALPPARVVWDINLTTIIQALQVVALLVALVYWFVVNANRGEENQRRLSELQANVSAQIAEVRQAVAVGLTDVRQQLSALPDQRARLDQVERRIADVDARYATLQARVEGLDRQTVELRSDLNSITRASNVPLQGAHR
jgi:flagellar motility protein MotE (MotC chaperone)